MFYNKTQRKSSFAQTVTNQLKPINMKALFNKIDKLTNQIESGIYTKQQALLKVRELKAIIDYKYMPGSDPHTELLYPLIDANELAKELN